MGRPAIHLVSELLNQYGPRAEIARAFSITT